MNAPLEDLIITLGLPAALRLVERFGGVRVYLPRAENLTPEHPLAEAIGLEAARALCELWPQERPYVPRAKRHLRERRDQALLTDSRELSMPQLARKYDLTERAIYRALVRAREADDDRSAESPQPSFPF